jgi:hypothetical protein
MLTSQAINNTLINFLEQSKGVLQESDDQFAARVMLCADDYRKVINGTRKLSLLELSKFSEVLNVSLEAILTHKVDYGFLKKFLDDQAQDVLPEQYSFSALSKRRTIVNILDYIRKDRGTREVLFLLRYFQLTPKHFKDPEKTINNNFIVDLLKLCREQNYTNEEIIKMGKESYNSNSRNALGGILCDSNDMIELFEKIFIKHINLFDLNFDYQLLKLNNNECNLRVKAKADVCEQLNKKIIGSNNLDFYKQGVISTFSNYIGLPDAKVQLVRSTENDSFCEYKIDFIYH